MPVRLCRSSFFEPLDFGCDGKRGDGGFLIPRPRSSLEECRTTHVARLEAAFALHYIDVGFAVTNTNGRLRVLTAGQ